MFPFLTRKSAAAGVLLTVLIFAFGLAVVPAYAQDTATATPDGALLESLLQAAQSTTEPSAQTTEDFSFAAVLPTQLHVERLSDGGFVVGDPNAPITLVEFADWACPHCQEYVPVLHEVLVNYVLTGQARFEYRSFPTAGGQQTAAFSVIAECADSMITDTEGVGYGFWLASDVLYAMAENGTYFTQEALDTFSAALELSPNDLLVCARAQLNPQVIADYVLGQVAGVQGTPAVMVRYTSEEGQPPHWILVNGTTYDRGAAPYAAISSLIEAANAPGFVIPNDPAADAATIAAAQESVIQTPEPDATAEATAEATAAQ